MRLAPDVMNTGDVVEYLDKCEWVGGGGGVEGGWRGGAA